MKNILILCLSVLLLAACADDEVPPVRLAVDDSPKIRLDVLTVTVLDRSDPLVINTPYTTDNLKPTILNSIRSWASSKLVAVGTTGEAILVIRDARLTSQNMHKGDDWFTRQQASKYVGHASVELDISGREGHGLVTADAGHFETLPEDPTSVEKQNAYTKLLNSMMPDLTNNLRAGIRDHLAAFVVTAAQAP